MLHTRLAACISCGANSATIGYDALMTQDAHTSDDDSSQGLQMPTESSESPNGDVSPETANSFGRKVAQLVVIPAVIASGCVVVLVIFGLLAGQPQSIDEHLARLRQSSGIGHNLPGGLQDPRYKDRCHAAHVIAQMLPGIDDDDERGRVSVALVDILDNNVAMGEDVLESYLLIAIAQLGQEGGLEAILSRAASPQDTVRQGVVAAISAWPADRRQEPDQALSVLRTLISDASPQVSAMAAAVAGDWATPDDAMMIATLRAALQDTAGRTDDTYANAAIALARLGDANGSAIVANVLLDREALAKIAKSQTIGQLHERQVGAMVDRMLLTTLASAEKMPAPCVWEKIKALASDDTSLPVKKTTLELLNRKAQHNDRIEMQVNQPDT